MSDSHPVAKPRTEHTLLATTDAMVWAQEFCRIFAGATIVQDASANPHFEGVQVDEGTMVGWFANAMQTAVNYLPIEEEDDEPSLEEHFMEGFGEGRTEDGGKTV